MDILFSLAYIVSTWREIQHHQLGHSNSLNIFFRYLITLSMITIFNCHKFVKFVREKCRKNIYFLSIILFRYIYIVYRIRTKSVGHSNSCALRTSLLFSQLASASKVLSMRHRFPKND